MEKYLRLITKLEELGVLHQFLNNVEEFLSNDGTTLAEAYETSLSKPYEDVVIAAFPWESTLEKESFWRRVHNEVNLMYKQNKKHYETK